MDFRSSLVQPPSSLVLKGIGVMERDPDWVACWAVLTNSSLLMTVIFLASPPLKMETDTMRLPTVSVLALPLGNEHTALSLFVEKTVGDYV